MSKYTKKAMPSATTSGEVMVNKNSDNNKGFAFTFPEDNPKIISGFSGLFVIKNQPDQIEMIRKKRQQERNEKMARIFKKLTE